MITVIWFAVKPCLEKMKDGGVIKKEELHVLPKDAKTQTVSIPTASEPEWASISFNVQNTKDIILQPMDKQNKPAGAVKVTSVAGKSGAVEIHFDTVVKAASVVVHITPNGAAHPKAEVTSVKACIPKKGAVPLFLYTCVAYLPRLSVCHSEM